MGVIKQKDFDSSKLKVGKVEGDRFKKIPFVYGGGVPVIEVEGWFSLYTNWFDGKKSHSVALEVNPGFDFEGLEKRMIELASEEFPEKSLPYLHNLSNINRNQQYIQSLIIFNLLPTSQR